MNIILYSFVGIISYLIGSLPMGYWYARYFYGIDLTQAGSKNIGASNTGRLLGGVYHFVIIALLDITKSMLPILLLDHYFPYQIQLKIFSAIFLMLGNSFSIFLAGQGGKGVATYVGILAGFWYQYLFFLIPCWLIIKIICKSSACASILTVILFPFWYLFFIMHADYYFFSFLMILAFWIVIRHKNNIYSLL